MKPKSKRGGTTPHEEVVKLFKSKPGIKLSFKQIKKEVSHKFPVDIIYAAVKDLEDEQILISRGTHYKLKADDRNENKNLQSVHTIEGQIEMTMNGNAYLVNSALPSDLKIHASNLASALDGDLVKVKILPQYKRKKLEGIVVEIVKRNTEKFTGNIQISDRFAFVKPDKNKMQVDIYVPLNLIGEAKNGDKVEVQIIEWHNDKKNPVGKVMNVLGEAGSSDVEMKSILIENGFKLEFDKETLQETEAISESISQEEILKRRDLRSEIVFTIDPFDAQDFDDAISYKKLGDDDFEIGVHIADVTHYIKPDSAIDKEAEFRTTSVYLVDRVLPMLPEKLSNNLCSLRPHEDKLCFSVIWKMKGNGKIADTWIGKTIIHSKHRFTYEDAQTEIENGTGEWGSILKSLNDITVQIREKRFKDGAIDFDTVEIKFKLDEKGKPLEVIQKERKASNLLIEDLMLLANKSVAEFIEAQKKKLKSLEFVYRVHDLPNEEKLTDFANLAALFGYKLTMDTPKQIAKSFNKLMAQVKGKPEQNMLESLGIRTMAKAKYTTQNIGHYGLSFEHYSHFTSPIRRYPDVLAHRILYNVLCHQPHQIKNLEKLCEHCSEMEKHAADAERQSVKYKQIEFVENEVGIIQEGIITGVTHWGLFVELIKSKAEGLVRAESFNDDWYTFEEKKHRYVGKNSGQIYQLGQKVEVRITKTNRLQRTIDMVIPES